MFYDSNVIIGSFENHVEKPKVQLRSFLQEEGVNTVWKNDMIATDRVVCQINTQTSNRRQQSRQMFTIVGFNWFVKSDRITEESIAHVK